jgi:hypothetical protein
VIIYYKIGFNFTDPIIEWNCIEVMRSISNDFFQNGGINGGLPVNKMNEATKTQVEVNCGIDIDTDRMKKIIAWADRNLNMNIVSIYLSPLGIYLCSIELKVLKLNFLKFLCWINGHSAIYNPLFLNLIDTLNGNKVLLSKTIPDTRKRTATSSNPLIISSNLFVICKFIQIFNYLTFASVELSGLNYEYQWEDDLMLNAIYLELSSSKSKENILKTSDTTYWSTPLLVDRIWNSLVKIRSGIRTNYMHDPFGIENNVLPHYLVNYISDYYSKLKNDFMNQFNNKLVNRNNDVTDSVSNQDIFKLSIETSMRTILTAITPTSEPPDDEKEAELNN